MTELCSNFFSSCCGRSFIFLRKMLTEKKQADMSLDHLILVDPVIGQTSYLEYAKLLR